MKQHIKAVCFDFGGVIELYPPGKILTFIAELFGIHPDEYKQEYFKHNHLTNIENQRLEDVFIKAASVFNTNKETEQAARKAIQKRMADKRLNTELLTWFSVLKKQGFKVGILSNFTTDLSERVKEYGLDTVTDTILISAEIGFQKPHKEAFDILFERLDVLPQETIFIDDSRKCLEKSEEIGYHPILFIDNEQLKKDLQSFGIEL